MYIQGPIGAGREGDDRGWDDWMASLTQWTQLWVNSGSWWWTGRTGVLRFMGSQSVGHNWVTGLNWECLRPYSLRVRLGWHVSDLCFFTKSEARDVYLRLLYSCLAPGELVEMQSSIQSLLAGTWNSAFLASSQMMWILLGGGPHFE